MVYALLLVTSQALAEPLPAPPLPPRWGYDALWMGAAWEAGTPPGSGDTLWDHPVEFDLMIRNVGDGPLFIGAGVEHRLRLSRDETGRTVIDELSLEGRVVGLDVRPAMGDMLDLQALGARWDQTVYGLARNWTHLIVFVPLDLVGAGFSDTDADSDTTLRYYAGAGAGLGAEWLVRVVGPVGLRLRAEGGGGTMHRLRPGEDQVRHEVWGRGEGDLVLVDDEMPLTFGVWYEHRSQWEPRDAIGVARNVDAFGLRFGLRLFRGNLPGMQGPDGNPANERAIGREEWREARKNGRNGILIEGEPEGPVEEPVLVPATPEEHEANNEQND